MLFSVFSCSDLIQLFGEETTHESRLDKMHTKESNVQIYLATAKYSMWNCPRKRVRS